MKFGIHIGHMGGPLTEMRKLWKFADAKGFDWFSVSDHFQESPPRGGDMDCYEAIATLTAAATRLGRGDFSASIPPGGAAEVGALAHTMEDMRRNLISLTSTLRQRDADHLERMRIGLRLGRQRESADAIGLGMTLTAMLAAQLDPLLRTIDRPLSLWEVCGSALLILALILIPLAIYLLNLFITKLRG